MDVLQVISLPLLYFLILINAVCPSGTGFYMDTPHQTILLDKLSKKQQRYLKDEMLDILGLDDVPKVNRHKKQTVPQYMLDLYNQHIHSFDENEDFQNAADLIISFVNHGKFLWPYNNGT